MAKDVELEIQKLASADYGSLLHGAEARLRAAQNAIAGHRATEAEALQRELLPEARDAIRAACQAILDETAHWIDVGHRASARVHQVQAWTPETFRRIRHS